MPNHVITQIVFRNVDAAAQAEILSKVSSKKAEIDFEVLLPIPLNIWLGNVGTKHEETFRAGNALEWCSENWGTKWNAYGLSEGAGPRYSTIAQTDDTLTLTFQTAWSTPYGWLVALQNSIGRRFEYRWLSEGQHDAFAGYFEPVTDDWKREPWSEYIADEQMRRHLHLLKWGVEEFPDEDGAA
ncbi:hypothetical protein VW35_02450 [Devosia soli]|uniref:YubB ferredoxin-like domain-containing protein n=1 Tax=Devosia soli TaxID=361041 RepID=A0A0F5LHL4_9HYPH|nr:hypothetical protein [Devosia soli]KKB81047.1 hypothetical protein VW35_02450 [Devosia soli]